MLLEKEKTTPIKTIETWAFVMPEYDLTDVDEMCPTTRGYAVGFCVYGWDHDKQKWKWIGGGEHNECVKKARKYHEDMLQKYDIKP